MSGKLVVGVGGGIVCGVVLGFLLCGDGEPRLADAGLWREAVEPSVSTATVTAPGEVIETVRVEAGKGPDELFSAALIRHFESGFHKGWHEVRDDDPDEATLARGRETFEETVLGLPRDLGRSAGETAVRRDRLDAALRDGDGLTLIELAADGTWEPDDALEVLDLCCAPREHSGTVDGDQFAGAGKVQKGLVIHFGAGVHTLSPRRLTPDRGEPFPSDITIQGAGMDATLLNLEEISLRHPVERLAFRNLTIFTCDDYGFDLRNAGAVLDYEGVRSVGFDIGAGGSLCFSVNRGVMIRARDSQFLGGYGRHPGSGNLWRGDTLVARFERCRFELVDLEVGRLRSGKVVFQQCVFGLMDRDPMKSASTRVLFQNCVLEPVTDPKTAFPDKRKDLGELSPYFK